jgi:mannose-6-phosphate isomerase-like protein (cupin superfamily)
MADYTVKRIEDMEAIYRGSFIKVRAELGITSFGMQIVALPPDAHAYPEHDHGTDGQEEVYLVLDGTAEMEIEGERFPLDSETMVRVASGTMRKLHTADEGARVLVIGAVPGKPYEIVQFTELGEPDPMLTT